MRTFTGSRAQARKQGIALLYAVFGAFVAASIAGVLFAIAGVTNVRSDTQRSSLQAQYLAEGAVEAGRKEVIQAIANWEAPPEDGTADIDGRQVPYTIEPTGGGGISTDPAGIQTIHLGYEIEAVTTVDGIQARAHRIIDAASTPIFQFAVFYANDLEIQPGPDMTLGGRVHTNGDMYLGCGETLTMDTNYVHSGGKMFRRRKDSNESKGTVEIRKWVENPYDPAEPSVFEKMLSQSQLPVDNDSGYDSAFLGWDDNGDLDYDDANDWLPFIPGALDFWGAPDAYGQEGYTVLTGDHGVTEIVTPNVGSIAMFDEAESGSYSYDPILEEYVFVGTGNGTHDKGYYHESAGLAIIVDEDGGGFTVYDENGDEVDEDDYEDAIWLKGIFDARQSDSGPARTALVRVDLEELADSDAWPNNGLLYAAHYGMGTGTDAKGILLTNGDELETNLTVVTEGSLYIHGDYNVDDKKSAAVIGDAINLLSNAWDDSKDPGDLPSAADTTFNTAMITGNYETESGKYNGGLENLPRFHEKWSGKDCNINGSFVCAWESQYATGEWKYGSDRYKAPKRNWSYDPRFNSVANLPPFTPMVVSAEDVVAW